MKKNIIIISIIVTFSALAVYLYKESAKAENLSASYISAINLDMYLQRGMVITRKIEAKENDSIKNISLPNLKKEIQNVDFIFDENPKLAAAKYEELLKLDPGNISLHLRLGMLYLKNSQFLAAKEHLYFVYEQKDSGLQPDSYWYLGLLYTIEGERAKADQYLKGCLNSKCSYKKEAQTLIEAL